MEIKVNVTVNGEVDVQKIAEQIRQQFEKAQKPALKVGDYAKVVDDKETNVFSIGEFVKITDVNYRHWDYQAVSIYDEDRDEQFLARELTKVTDEEAAKIENELAEEDEIKRWATIGRKPGEYKKGDIVKVVRIEYGIPNGHTEGSIGEVVKDKTVDLKSGVGVLVILNDRKKFNNVELITPVEARFDLK